MESEFIYVYLPIVTATTFPINRNVILTQSFKKMRVTSCISSAKMTIGVFPLFCSLTSDVLCLFGSSSTTVNPVVNTALPSCCNYITLSKSFSGGAISFYFQNADGTTFTITDDSYIALIIEFFN